MKSPNFDTFVDDLFSGCVESCEKPGRNYKVKRQGGEIGQKGSQESCGKEEGSR